MLIQAVAREGSGYAGRDHQSAGTCYMYDPVAMFFLQK